MTEEKYRVVAPEAMHETFMSDSEEEGQFRWWHLIAFLWFRSTWEHCMTQNSKPLISTIWLAEQTHSTEVHQCHWFDDNVNCSHITLCVFSIFPFFFELLEPFIWTSHAKGDANDLVLGTSIGNNLDQQSNGSHIYLSYHNGDGMTRKCFAFSLLSVSTESRWSMDQQPASSFAYLLFVPSLSSLEIIELKIIYNFKLIHQ